MKDADLRSSTSRELLRLMSLDAGPPAGDEELSAVLRHQLAAPLIDELREIKADAAIPAELGDVRTVAELLHHPQPPVGLVRLAKQLMKDRGQRDDELLPREVAAVLYVACICTALLRCDERITDADAPALRRRIQWALSQPWIDDAPLRKLLEEADLSLEASR